MTRSKLFSLIALLFVILTVNVQPGYSAAFPERDIVISVPANPGGGGDTFARQTAEAVNSSTSGAVNMVIENYPSGGGAAAMSSVWRKPHDGYSLLLITNSTVISNPYSYTMPRPVSDFKGVIRVQTDATVLIVNPSKGIKTVEEFIEKAKTQKMTVGGFAVGSVEHIAAFLLAKEAGVEFEYVPYDTSADAIVAVMGGHIDATFTQYADVSGNHKAGAVLVLGAAALQRYPTLPDIPTFAEKGWKVPELANWRGYAVPSDVPDDVVKILHDVIKKATAQPSYQEYTNSMALSDAYVESGEFTKLIDEQYKQMGITLKEIGLLK